MYILFAHFCFYSLITVARELFGKRPPPHLSRRFFWGAVPLTVYTLSVFFPILFRRIPLTVYTLSECNFFWLWAHACEAPCPWDYTRYHESRFCFILFFKIIFIFEGIHPFLSIFFCIYHACQGLSFIYFLPWGHMLLSDLINFWVPSPFLIKINKK